MGLLLGMGIFDVYVGRELIYIIDIELVDKVEGKTQLEYEVGVEVKAEVEVEDEYPL